MTTLSRNEAVETLSQKVNQIPVDELQEVFAELFPDSGPPSQRAALVQPIVARVRQGLEGEEIVDLWNVLFPEYRTVWFDESDDCIHFGEEHEESAAQAAAERD
jgi:hypothetical protein